MKMRTLLAVIVGLAGILYSAWVLEFVLDTGLDPMRSFLSELDAANRPFREVFSWGDRITGTLALIGAAIGLSILPRRRLTVVGWSAFGVFGASTIADALAPIECIPGIDPGCPSGPSGLFPQLHHIHALTSSVAVFAIFVTMVTFTLAARRYGSWPLLRTWGLAVFVVVTVTTAWMLIADNLPGDYSLGLAQRIQIAGMSVWMVMLGVASYRTPAVTWKGHP
ncbi:hypothetical protein GCM10007304_35230 [Rhodococcoides trifolii]|uniref:DUF998 domain-containing protein n=1 Tax=Rhodococcoides trifolii TaxID=908250 RepID=A0A917G1F0_9NOCA|nr:DUF998 domain-containing protein [Rhodococcus trifolii]GGG18169.1 hypothetical protein GCM10007304_35230 [Rhodococcus trifolii]